MVEKNIDFFAERREGEKLGEFKLVLDCGHEAKIGEGPRKEWGPCCYTTGKKYIYGSDFAMPHAGMRVECSLCKQLEPPFVTTSTIKEISPGRIYSEKNKGIFFDTMTGKWGFEGQEAGTYESELLAKIGHYEYLRSKKDGFIVQLDFQEQFWLKLVFRGTWANYWENEFGQTPAGSHLDCNAAVVSDPREFYGIRCIEQGFSIRPVGEIEIPTPCQADPHRVTMLKIFFVNPIQTGWYSYAVEPCGYVHDSDLLRQKFEEWLDANCRKKYIDDDNLAYQRYLLGR